MKPCPSCGRESQKVIYAGLPTNLCDTCDICFGGFAWLMAKLPYNGWFLEYDDNYWSALWYWLTNDPDEDD